MKNFTISLASVLCLSIFLSNPAHSQLNLRKLFQNAKEDAKQLPNHTRDLTVKAFKHSANEFPNGLRDSYEAGKFMVKSSRQPSTFFDNTNELTQYNQMRKVQRRASSDNYRKDIQEINEKYDSPRKQRWGVNR